MMGRWGGEGGEWLEYPLGRFQVKDNRIKFVSTFEINAGREWFSNGAHPLFLHS